MSSPLLASQLYAISQGHTCAGFHECHWCGGPCDGRLTHDDPPPSIGVRRQPCKRPANPYCCLGCWLFRRKRVTVSFLAGGYRDGRSPLHFSWWVTEKGAWALDKDDGPDLYECLLDPPSRFFLAMLDGADVNHLQLAVANDNPPKSPADTKLHFTINGIPHDYTVYELTEALTSSSVAGKEPGVAALVKLLGPYEEMSNPGVKGRGPGRPPKGENRPNRPLR
jgi:hypothetical protein